MLTFRSFLGIVSLAWLAGCATAPTAPGPAEAKALGILASSRDVHEKARACQELAATTAGPSSVPALAALLNDEQLSDYARSALEGIRDPAAGEALRDALPKLEGRRLAGVVNSLGVRREKAAVPELRALAFDPKRGVAPEAVASLGLIGTADAAEALLELLACGPADLQIPTAHASLVAAEFLARERNVGRARSLLDALIRAKPSDHIVAVAQNRATALRAPR